MVPALARRVAAAVFLGVLLTPSPFRAQSVTTTSASTRSFTNARLGMTVVGTEIDLPYGRWNVASIAPAGVIDQVYVLPEESAANSPGRRADLSQMRTNGLVPPTVRKTEPAGTRSAAANVRHAMMALLRNPTAQTVTLTLSDAATTRRMDVRWTLAGRAVRSSSSWPNGPPRAWANGARWPIASTPRRSARGSRARPGSTARASSRRPTSR